MPPRQRASDAFAKVGHADAATAIEPAAPPPVPEAPDDALLGRWRWSLGASARKAVAAQARADTAQAAWDRLVADARAAGIPERLVVAAAADAGLDVPAGK